jgi:hypothetical protein
VEHGIERALGVKQGSLAAPILCVYIGPGFQQECGNLGLPFDGGLRYAPIETV